jgi:hypothetical protein
LDKLMTSNLINVFKKIHHGQVGQGKKKKREHN